MERPEPAEDWPDGPLTEAEAAALLEDGTDPDREGVRAVWVMTHGDGVRRSVVPGDAPEDAVVDVVLETEDAFEMYSYTGGEWMDYGTQRKDDEEAPSMAGTLEQYRVLAGESGSF